MTAINTTDSPQIRAAKRRRVATVCVDLRAPGRAVAVAVDRQGTLSAWATVADRGGSLALAKLAINKLAVRPKTLRILLGSEHTHVGFAAQDKEPGQGEICEALLAEGHERLAEPAVAAVAVAPGTWLVAAGAANKLDPLADGLAEITAAEPSFVVDQLLAIESLEPGSALVEYGKAGLLIAVRGHGSLPRLRVMTTVPDSEQAAAEIHATLGQVDLQQSLEVLGSESAGLSQTLTLQGFETRGPALPTCDDDTLPAGYELAWRLATDPQPKALHSPEIENRQTSLTWARRVTWVAVVLGIFGALLVASGLTTSWRGRARSEALESQNAGIEDQIKQLQETAELAEEVQNLRTDLAGQGLPWPQLGATLTTLARDLPLTVGCRRLAVIDGELELEATTAGPDAARELELARRAIDRSPGISNLFWEEPEVDANRIVTRQVFRGRLEEPFGTERGPS